MTDQDWPDIPQPTKEDLEELDRLEELYREAEEPDWFREAVERAKGIPRLERKQPN